MVLMTKHFDRVELENFNEYYSYTLDHSHTHTVGGRKLHILFFKMSFFLHSQNFASHSNI